MILFLFLFITLIFNVFSAEQLTSKQAYELLAIPESSNWDEIKKAYKALYKSHLENCYKSCLQQCEFKNRKKHKLKFCAHCTFIQKFDLERFKPIKLAYNFLEKKFTHAETYDLKLVEDRFILYHQTLAITLLKTYLKDIEAIKNDLKKEDPELDDFSEFADYTNNLRLALFYLERNQFLKAKELLLKTHEQHPDFDFDNVLESLEQILNFKHVKEIELAQKKLL
ncbi:MAG: hypothetical protein P4L22_06945 [Candidatus Babeliales bacterium]|nr:hypothetical protein [Candidatus Babeliales bacterium]